MALPKFNGNYKKAFRVCTVQDPAIDVDKSNLSEYGRTADEKFLKLLPGQQPTWFYLRWLGQSTFAQILDTTTSNISKLQLAFAYCVEKIENPPGGGAVLIPSTHIPALGYNIFDISAFSDVFDLPTVLWIGGVAHDRHFLVNGTSPTYSLPHALTKYILSKKKEKLTTLASVGPKDPSNLQQPTPPTVQAQE